MGFSRICVSLKKNISASQDNAGQDAYNERENARNARIIHESEESEDFANYDSIQVLTIQAAISSGVVIILMVSLAIAQVIFHVHTIDVEGLEYDVRSLHYQFS